MNFILKRTDEIMLRLSLQKVRDKYRWGELSKQEVNKTREGSIGIYVITSFKFWKFHYSTKLWFHGLAACFGFPARLRSPQDEDTVLFVSGFTQHECAHSNSFPPRCTFHSQILSLPHLYGHGKMPCKWNPSGQDGFSFVRVVGNWHCHSVHLLPQSLPIN